jgi:uridine kinase
MKKTLTVIKGEQCSGKTTLATEIANSYRVMREPVVIADGLSVIDFDDTSNVIICVNNVQFRKIDSLIYNLKKVYFVRIINIS